MEYEKIKPYIEKGLISEQVHPENEDVRIFNYTQMCQFDRAWDEITRQCRGLILNVKTGEVIARPFPKFFNYQEHVQNAWPIPGDKPVISEKLDGSLGIMYWLNDKPWIATRGSFMSDQAQWATAYLREGGNGKEYFWKRAGLDHTKEWTHLFEIIYPENRIVVNYDFSDLVYLTSINNATGEAKQWDFAFRTAKTFEIDDVQNLMKLDEPNSEGFVIFYPKENVRMKIKFPEYVRLHKIVTGVSEIGIWEILRDGGDFKPLIEKVPDEFYKWVMEVKTKLEDQFAHISNQAAVQYAVAMTEAYPNQGEDVPRKDKALAIKKHMEYPGIGFALLDEKPVDAMIWKMIRPHGKHIFKTDIDL